MAHSKIIQTGVDKLVDLVMTEGMISSKDAANRLGVSLATITEWSSFLEEEAVISIKYKFTVPYLSKRKISSEEQEKVEERLKEERSIFRRKSESTLNYLYMLEKEVVVLKQLLADLGGNLGRVNFIFPDGTTRAVVYR